MIVTHKIFKNNPDRFKILETVHNDLKSGFRILKVEGCDNLGRTDVLWTEEDKQRGRTENMVIIRDVNPSLSHIVITGLEDTPLDEVRNFSDEELFIKIATMNVGEDEEE